MDEKELLDWGARIGVATRLAAVEKNQLENLIASLDSVSGREALLATAAYALRQAQRLANKEKQSANKEKQLDKNSKDKQLDINRKMVWANLIKEALIDLFHSYNADKEHARKMLDFAKWVYEAELHYYVDMNNVNSAIERLKRLTLLELLKQHKTR